MPLLEINQSRHICASVRLDEVTAAQVDQYAAFIHASARTMLWTRRSNMIFSKDRDFQDFLKTPQAKQVASSLCVSKRSRGMRSSRHRSVSTRSSGELTASL